MAFPKLATPGSVCSGLTEIIVMKESEESLECWLPKLHDDASILFDDALDPNVGPYHVIQQLIANHEWRLGPVIGKTVTLIKGGGSGS